MDIQTCFPYCFFVLFRVFQDGVFPAFLVTFAFLHVSTRILNVCFFLFSLFLHFFGFKLNYHYLNK